MEGGGEKIIHLLCPSLSKAIQLVAGEEQKVDLGSIARAFGLDPNTLKLNGYFVSRGADLIASSVTWKSLIGFFSARGLPTGASASAALLVHGKLSKIGSKRSHDNTSEMCYLRDSKRTQHEQCSVPGLVDSRQHNGLCLKRKWRLEDPKRTSSDEAVSGSGLQENKGGAFKIGRFSCSIISKNLKRMRIDEIVAAPPVKKLR